MKKYIKPTCNVIELQAKENIAAIRPSSITITGEGADAQTVYAYDLTSYTAGS